MTRTKQTARLQVNTAPEIKKVDGKKVVVPIKKIQTRKVRAKNDNGSSESQKSNPTPSDQESSEHESESQQESDQESGAEEEGLKTPKTPKEFDEGYSESGEEPHNMQERIEYFKGKNASLRKLLYDTISHHNDVNEEARDLKKELENTKKELENTKKELENTKKKLDDTTEDFFGVCCEVRELTQDYFNLETKNTQKKKKLKRTRQDNFDLARKNSQVTQKLNRTCVEMKKMTNRNKLLVNLVHIRDKQVDDLSNANDRLTQENDSLKRKARRKREDVPSEHNKKSKM